MYKTIGFEALLIMHKSHFILLILAVQIVHYITWFPTDFKKYLISFVNGLEARIEMMPLLPQETTSLACFEIDTF